MSNLESAKAAIEAELSQAKQGLAYYQSHIAALEGALAQLDTLVGGSVAGASGKSGKATKTVKAAKSATATKGQRGRPSKAGKAAVPTGKAKTAKSKAPKGESNLPKTGGDYWPNLITSQPQAAKDVLKAAVAGLGFEATPEQVQKLQQRMTFALNALVKDKKIQDSGSGRERRYFK